MRKNLIIISFLIVTMVQLVMPITVWATGDSKDFKEMTDKECNDGTVMSHVWYSSPNAENLDSVPLIVYLHGGGAFSGDGFPSFVKNWGSYGVEGFEAYVLCPKLPGYNWMWDGDNKAGKGMGFGNKGIQKHLKNLIEHFIDKQKNVDRKNIILMGHSNGGWGVIQAAINNEDNYFSKFVVLSGTINGVIGDLSTIDSPIVVMCGEYDNYYKTKGRKYTHDTYYNWKDKIKNQDKLRSIMWPRADHNSYFKDGFCGDSGMIDGVRNC